MTLYTPSNRPRPPDPFKTTVLPPIDSHLIRIAEERGKQSARVEALEAAVLRLENASQRAAEAYNASQMQMAQHFGEVNRLLKDIHILVNSGQLEEDKQKKKHRRDLIINVLTFLTSVAGAVAMLLKVISR